MKQVGLTYRWIASDADFNKFAIKFNILLVATLVSLWMLCQEGKPVLIAIDEIEISKLTFHDTMWILAETMAFACYFQFLECVVTAMFVHVEIDSVFERLGVELAMLHGFFALVFFLMSSFGFIAVSCFEFFGKLVNEVTCPFVEDERKCKIGS